MPFFASLRPKNKDLRQFTDDQIRTYGDTDAKKGKAPAVVNRKVWGGNRTAADAQRPILVPLDGSPFAEHALPLALNRAGGRAQHTIYFIRKG